MDALTLAEQQNIIVTTLAEGVTVAWDAMVLNIEIDLIDDDRRENCITLAYTKEGAQWKRNSILLPHACYDLFVNLRESMKSEQGESWKACTLEVHSSGKYRFAFSYDPPTRLRGIHDDDSMLKNYVPGW